MASKFTLSPVMTGVVVAPVFFATWMIVGYLFKGYFDTGTIPVALIGAVLIGVLAWRTELKKRQQAAEAARAAEDAGSNTF